MFDDALIPPAHRQWAAQAEMFGNRLRKNFKKLREPVRRRELTAWRLYSRDIPELPFLIDWYDGRLHVAEWLRPHDRSEHEHAEWIDRMIGEAARVLEVPERNVFIKRRERQRGNEQYRRFGHAGAEVTVTERGMQFITNLSDYLDTGLFLDHRDTRDMVRRASHGARVLNLYAYTGSFSVAAAMGGAQQVVTVDLSRNYLNWARRNFALNGIDTHRHEFLEVDSLRFLRSWPELSAKFDIAVVDPPTFSNSARLDDTFDVQRDHVDLLQAVLKVMRPNGTVFFSTNARRFHLDQDAFAGAEVVEITDKTVPFDFDGERPHRCWRANRRG